MTDDPKKPVASTPPSETSSAASSPTASPTASADEQPEIYGLTKGKNGIVLKRRSFLGALAATGALASAGTLTGCIPLPGFRGGDPTALAEAARKAKAHESAVVGLEFRDDSLFSWDAKEIKLWDVARGSKKDAAARPDFVNNGKANFPNLFRRVWDNPVLGFRQDGKALAIDGKDGIALWHSSQENLVKTNTLKGGPKQVSALGLDPDGTLAAAGGQDGSITVWNLENGKKQGIPGAKSRVSSVVFHPVDPVLLTSHYDGKIREWRLPSGKAGPTLDCQNQPIFHLAVTPDGKLAVTQSAGKTIKLWSLPDGKEKALLEVPQEETANTMNIDANGRFLAVGTVQGRIYLWRLPEGELIGNLFDPDLLDKGTPMSQYRQMGPQLQTLPCGTPIPPDATCVCDCVSASRAYNTTQQVCICDTIAVPAGQVPSGRIVCVCDTIAVGTRVPVSPPKAPSGCSCVSNVSRGGGHYWRPN